MSFRMVLCASICIFGLTACHTNIPVQNVEEPLILSKEDDIPEEENYSAQMSPIEYLPSVFPEWCLDDIVPEDAYVRACLTDGNVIIVPDMKFVELPQTFKDTFICLERDNIYGDRAGTYTDQEAQDVFYAVYQSEDLQIITMYYNPVLKDKYTDAGEEYIREIIALSDKFCTYQGAHIGDPAVRFIGSGIKTWQTSGTPYMVFGAEKDILNELYSCSFSEISSLKSKEIQLLTHKKQQ